MLPSAETFQGRRASGAQAVGSVNAKTTPRGLVILRAGPENVFGTPGVREKWEKVNKARLRFKVVNNDVLRPAVSG